MIEGPSIDDIRDLRRKLGHSIYQTPVLRCAALEDRMGGGTEVSAKLEFLQRTGTFKARGALANASTLSPEQKKIGITAVSAGNHAIAAAFAAKSVGTSAKIVMISSANPARIEACRHYGAEVVLVGSAHDAFDTAERIQAEEGRFFMHPFEGPEIATGTGMVGLEIAEQCAGFDAVVVSVGGGGLIGGISNALKKLRPDCEVFGVEPDGADSMRRSLAAGEPQSIDSVETIADSLGAPFALPYSFGMVQQYVDELTSVSDDDIRDSMRLLFHSMKFAVEPACAASTAAMLGPLRSKLAGRKVVLVMCGSNIDWDTFAMQAMLGHDCAA